MFRKLAAAGLIAVTAVLGSHSPLTGDNRNNSSEKEKTYQIETKNLVSSRNLQAPRNVSPIKPAVSRVKTICNDACVRYVAVVILKKALGDNPPSGCAAGYTCARGGIRAKRPCAIPEYICDRESNPYDDSQPGFVDVLNGQNQKAKGKYQFMDGTFRYAIQGQIAAWKAKNCDLCKLLVLIATPYASGNAAMAPEWVQDAAASWLFKQPGGPGNWACC